MTSKSEATTIIRQRTLDSRRPRMPRFISMQKLLQSPAPLDWVVSGVLPANAIVGFVGATESFKSAVVCDVAMSVASGMPWHGRKVKQGPVFILAGEGQAGFARRFKAIALDRNLKTTAIPIRVSRRGVGLVSREHAVALNLHLSKLAKKLGKRPALVVIDTVARNFAPGDENNASDMSTFIENVDLMRRRFGCAIILVHHSGHGDKSRARGSSAFKAALDHEVVFDRRGDQVTMKCTKSKDARPFEPISLDVEEVPLPWKNDNGEQETSFVLRPADLAATSGAAPAKQIAVYRVLKQVLAKAAEKNEKSVSVEVWRKEVLRAGIVKDEGAFEKLKAKLKAKGKVKAIRRGFITIEN